MKEFTIDKNDAGQRLDRYIGKTVPLLPTSLAQKYIRIKRIKVNGKGSKRDYKLLHSDNVQFYVNDEFFEQPTEYNAYLSVSNPALDIIYEDDNILLVNKEVGVLCHSGEKFEYSTLITRIQAYLFTKGEWEPKKGSFSPALCNRIDRNTSGIVIAAKNADSLRIINEKIRTREIDKYYLATVHGKPEPASSRLEGFIFKDSVKNQVFVTQIKKAGTKTAVTEYRTISNNKTLTLLECRLITGRTHQIRAQLSNAGHPLLGDGKYGSERLNKVYGEKHQALCSYKLVFNFITDSGVLNYLNGQTFKVRNIDFAKKYFNIIDISDL